MDDFYMLEVKLKGLDEGVGEDGEAIIFSFSIPDDDLMMVEVNVFNAKAHGFHEAQPAAVHDLGDEFVCASEIGNEALDFIFGEDGGNGFGALRAQFGKLEFVQFNMKDMAVEEKNGAKCLVLGGGGDLLLIGKVGDELPDFGDAHFLRVALVVEEDVVSDPEDVGIFGAWGVVFDAKGIAILIEEFFPLRGRCVFG